MKKKNYDLDNALERNLTVYKYYKIAHKLFQKLPDVVNNLK